MASHHLAAGMLSAASRGPDIQAQALSPSITVPSVRVVMGVSVDSPGDRVLHPPPHSFTMDWKKRHMSSENAANARKILKDQT